MNKTILACAFCAVALLFQAAGAEDSSLRALLHLDAYGRKVEISVNGKRLTEIAGGSSQTVQLFHVDSPDKAKFLDNLKSLFCLKAGTNTIEIAYEPAQGSVQWQMDVNIRVAHERPDGKIKAEDSPVFEKMIDPSDREGGFTGLFYLGGRTADKAPIHEVQQAAGARQLSAPDR